MFGAICAGRMVQTNLEPVSPTQFIFHIPLLPTHPINHLVVFLLPDTVLPPNHSATVHIQFPNQPFKLLGAISTDKPSAIFRLKDAATQDTAVTGELILGISVEPNESVLAQLATLPKSTANGAGAGLNGEKVALLAKRIIGNAFNYLSSFADAENKVPMKAFQQWWAKFEKRLEHDPSFLERGEDA
ncbi:hypothetical protein RUND412_001386 [Rhizina undulata]